MKIKVPFYHKARTRLKSELAKLRSEVPKLKTILRKIAALLIWTIHIELKSLDSSLENFGESTSFKHTNAPSHESFFLHIKHFYSMTCRRIFRKTHETLQNVTSVLDVV